MKKKEINVCLILMMLLINVIIIHSFATTSNSSKQTKQNGIYKIAVGKNPDKTMEVKDSGKDNNSVVDINIYKNLTNQKFYFEYQKEGYYKITAFHTGKSLTAKYNKLTEGTEIVQSDYQGLDSQKWLVRDSNKNGWIISPLKNVQLSISIAKTIKNGEKLILSKTKDNDFQMFYLFDISKEQQTKQNAKFKIAVGYDPTKILEVKDASNLNNAVVNLATYQYREQQRFNFEYQNEGYYKITVSHSGKSLTARGNKIAEGIEIVQSDYQGLDSQKWLVRDSNKNGWVISPLSNPQLAISIDKTITNGSKLILSKTQDNNNQMFYLYDIIKERQTRKDGIYKIAVGKDAEKTIEVKDSSKSNNASIDIWKYVNSLSQKFYFEFQNEGFYKITAMHTGKCITVKDNKIIEGREIVQCEYKALDSQKWVVRDSNKNGWVISPLSNPNLSISIAKNIKNGEKLILSKTKDNDNQMFYLYDISKSEQPWENGIYKIAVGKDERKALEVKDANKSNNAIIDIEQYEYKIEQKFKLEYQENGYYKITVMHTGKSLTVKDNKMLDGTQIVQNEYKGLNSQKWILRDTHKNGWVISPLFNPEMVITINGEIKNSSNIILSKVKDNDNQMFYILNTSDRYVLEGNYGKSGLMFKGTGGQYLKFYKVGKGDKHLFLCFSIHGFEDSYYRDGQELTYMANEVFKYLKSNMTEELVDKWTVYITPSLNPDGANNGWTNNGPGRTTLYSWAPGNKGIDMNRCFTIGYKSTKNDRNYNGTQPFQAFEAEALRDFILRNQGKQNIVIDTHGWLNETLGDDEVAKVYRNEFGITKHIYAYGNGYFINWARSLSNTRAVLLELPEIKNHKQLIQDKYIEKYNMATMSLLRRF